MGLPLQIISGKRLMDRWNMSHMEIVFMVINHDLRITFPGMWEIPIEPVSADQSLMELIGYDGQAVRRNKNAADFTFYFPDVERIETECAVGFSTRAKVMTVSNIADRWKIEEVEVTNLLSEEGVEPVDPLGVALDSGELFELINIHKFLIERDLLYRRIDIESLERKYQEINPLNIREELSPAAIELIKKAAPEIEKLYAIIKDIGLNAASHESEYMKAITAEVGEKPSEYPLVSSIDLANEDLYTFTTGQEKRDFTGRLLKSILKKFGHKLIGAQRLAKISSQLSD